MKPTIRNKLRAGFTGVLLLMAVVSGVGIFSLFRMRHSAQDATRIGGQLNAVALEIQVHNLEAQRRINGYLVYLGKLDRAQARTTYLDEAEFEIHEIGGLAERAVKIAPDAEKRAKFQKIVASAAAYQNAVETITNSPEGESVGASALTAYQTAAEQLHEDAEDGEAAGRDAAQISQEDIAKTSQRATWSSIGFSLLGLLLGVTMSYTLTRAILTPVDHLKDVAEKVSLGDLEVTVRRYSEDEIGDLADSFGRMVAAVKYFRLEMEDATHDAPH